MPSDSRFKRLKNGPAAPVTLSVEGAEITALAGESVAAAMLAAGYASFRTTPVSGSARGPFCLMGACYDCLVEIDGRPNVQACMTLVAEGMQVRLMRGARDVGASTDG